MISSMAASKVVEGGAATCENSSVSLIGGDDVASPFLYVVRPPIRPFEVTRTST